MITKNARCLATCLLLFSVLAVLGSCTNRPPRRVTPETQRRQDVEEIEELLSAWKAAMLEGDTRGVHALFSRRKAAALPLEQFEQWYRENSHMVPEMFGGIQIHQIAPEGNGASVLVTWGNGRPDMLTFIREDGKWKMDLERSGDRVIR